MWSHGLCVGVLLLLAALTLCDPARSSRKHETASPFSLLRDMLRVFSQAIRDAFRIIDEVLADLNIVRGPDQVMSNGSAFVRCEE